MLLNILEMAVIVFVTSEQHPYTHRELAREKDVEFRLATYSDMFKFEYLPRAAYIFSDMDRLSAEQLAQAAKSYRMLRKNGLPAYNDPARFLGRYGLLRRLHEQGINQFNVYRADSFEAPRRWPVFVRTEGNHLRPLSALIGDQSELDRTVADLVTEGVPLSTLLIVEYSAEEVRPGLYRKLSVFRVAARMIGYTCVHDDQWIVKYGKPGIAPLELYDEEYRLVVENPYGEEMRAIFDLGGIDYGRVDFGLVGGRPQIYEINSNPDVKLYPKSNGIEQRDRSNDVFRDNYLAALKAIDFAATAAPEASATA